MKKTVSVFLLLTMLVSLLTVPSNAESEPGVVTRMTDFENLTAGEAFVRDSGWGSASEKGSPTAVIAEKDGNQYLSVTLPDKNSGFLIYPYTFEQDVFTLTGDIALPSSPEANTGYGVYFVPNLSKRRENAAMLYSYPNIRQTRIVGAGQFETVKNAYASEQWNSFEYTRKGTDVTVKVWAKGGDPNDCAVTNLTVPEGKFTPSLTLVSGSSGETVFYLDNLCVRNTVTYVADFEDQTVGKDYNRSGNFQSTVAGTVAQESGNKFFRTDLAEGAAGLVYPSVCQAARYRLRGDIRLDTANTAGTYGVELLPDRTDTANAIRLTARDGTDGTLTPGVWYTVEYTRLGGQVCLRVWKTADSRPALVLSTASVPESEATPAIRLFAEGTGASVSVDNLSVEKVPEIEAVAVQTAAGDGTYAVRFIATLDSLEWQKVGFTVTATPESGTGKQFETTACTAYNTVTAENELGLREEYSAAQLGGSYLVAIGIRNVPADAGRITFVVTPFCERADGTRVSGKPVTVCVNADATVAG